MDASPDLVLYVGAGCGYCADVRREAEGLGLELEERDAWADSEHLRALVEARGRRTVPVLRIASEGAPDRWMGESLDIIDYLHTRFGDGRRASPLARALRSRVSTALMWGLLLAGGLSPEPARSALWAAACGLASARSFSLAQRSGHWVHWAVAAAFALGALSIALAAAGLADIPWWYAALAVAGLALVASLVRRGPRAV